MRSDITDNVGSATPNEDDVREQLARILHGEEFERSPKISAFLNHVVTETLNGKHQYIKAHTIAISVFKKDENFDPQSDPLVRVNAVRLRRMLRQYYSSDGVSDELIIDIIKGSYVPRFYFRNQGDDAVSPEIISELIKGHSFPSIAVLSLRNLSDNLSYANYANGITQEIVNKLTRFKELVVIARSAINLTENKSINTKRLNKVIDARYVLNGSMLIDEDNIRINVELDDRVSNTNIWTHTYNKKLNVQSILEIQDEIAIHVATTIAQPFGVIIRKELINLKHKSTSNLSAYELFLHYYQYYVTLSAKDHLYARTSLEKAVALDPQFSDAWAALAIIYASEYQLNINLVSRDVDVRELAYQTARHAIKVDPDNARAHFAVFYTELINNDLDFCKDKAEQALALNPSNPLTLAIYGLHLALSGEWEEGLEKLEYAIVMNPAHPDFYYFPFVLNYYRQDLYKEALREAKKIHMPDYFWTHLILAAIYSALGDLKLAKRASHELLKFYPDIEYKARFELEKWSMPADLIDKILDSLRKTGLKVS